MNQIKACSEAGDLKTSTFTWRRFSIRNHKIRLRQLFNELKAVFVFYIFPVLPHFIYPLTYSTVFRILKSVRIKRNERLPPFIFLFEMHIYSDRYTESFLNCLEFPYDLKYSKGYIMYRDIHFMVSKGNLNKTAIKYFFHDISISL